MATLVLSPDAVIRFKAGRAAIHNPYSAEAATETDDAAVIAFIARFAVPQDPFDAMRTLPAASRPVAEQLLGQLTQAKVLIAADAPAGPPTPRGEAVTSLRVLARSAAMLADDVIALGLEPDDAPMTGVTLSRRVFAQLAAIDSLREEMKQLRAGVQDRQLRVVAAKHGASRLKVHVAQSAALVEGWINLRSRPPADVALNPAWGLPFPDGSAAMLYVMDALERLPLAEEARFFLRECRRVLGPGGALRLAVVGGPGAAGPLAALLKECGFGEAQGSAHMGGPRAELNLEQASGLPATAPRVYVDAVA